jgi:hypothetical protein
VHPESALPSRPSHKQSAFVSAPAPAREQGDKASAANAVGQAERDLFERDVRDLFDGDANFQRIDGGEYIDQQMLDMWMGWSMRAAIANHRAPAADAGGQS